MRVYYTISIFSLFLFLENGNGAYMRVARTNTHAHFILLHLAFLCLLPIYPSSLGFTHAPICNSSIEGNRHRSICCSLLSVFSFCSAVNIWYAVFSYAKFGFKLRCIYLYSDVCLCVRMPI